MKTLYFLTITIFLLLSFSCTRDELLSDEAPVVEGDAVHISINIDKASLTRSGMSQSQEQAVNNVFVLVFDKNGTKVSQSYFSSNITSSLTNVATVSGNNMSVYVFANLSIQNTGSSLVSRYFDNIYTIVELNKRLLYNLANDLNVNRSLVMYGSVTGVVIPPVTTKHISVTLHYAVAKVTLYVVKALTNSADSYSLTNWTVVNYPQKSYLVGQATDASGASDFANSATSIAWVDTTLVIGGVSTAAQYAFLYMYENRRGANSNTIETQKASNAPAQATAMVLRGYYRTNSTNTVAGITTTIYLGSNNFNDYNVNRGNEYSYVVKVKGINQVNVDSRVVSNNDGSQVNINNTTMDNHPDRRPVQIYSGPGTSTLTVTELDGVTPCTWLRLSLIDLNKAVDNRRVTYNPNVDMVTNMTLNFPATTPAVMTARMVYLYATENPAAGAISGMRKAILKVVSNAGLPNSQTVTTQLSQYGYQTMGPSAGFRTFTYSGILGTGASSDFSLVVENIEEASLNLTPGAVAGTEATTTMQWGFNQILSQQTLSINSDYYYRDGYEASLGLVFSFASGTINALLRAPYGRVSASGLGILSVTISENEMDPIFNTYPARYCFEKNRDADGDGKISNPNTNGVNEIFWYLPSAEELYGMYVGQYGLTNQLAGTTYHSSSELYGSILNTNSINYGTGVSGAISKSQAANVRCVRRLYPTLAPGVKNSPYVEPGTRIINNFGYAAGILRSSPVVRPVAIHSYNSAINNTISPRFQIAKKNCLLRKTNGLPIMTWSQASGWTTASNNSSTGVVESPDTGCHAYGEGPSDGRKWRLPTQREMYIIFFMRKELGVDNFDALLPVNYWTSTQMAVNLGSYGSRLNLTVGSLNKATAINVRCVKDL